MSGVGREVCFFWRCSGFFPVGFGMKHSNKFFFIILMGEGGERD